MYPPDHHLSIRNDPLYSVYIVRCCKPFFLPVVHTDSTGIVYVTLKLSADCKMACIFLITKTKNRHDTSDTKFQMEVAISTDVIELYVDTGKFKNIGSINTSTETFMDSYTTNYHQQDS